MTDIADSDDSDEEIVLLAAAYLLTKKRSRPRRPRVDNSALPDEPKTESPWSRTAATGSDEMLVSLTNLDRRSFEKLLKPVEREWKKYDVYGNKVGRKKLKPAVRPQRRVMTADGCMALTLMYLSSRSELKMIGLLFGVNELRARTYCELGMKLLNKVRTTDVPAHRAAPCICFHFRIFGT